MAVSDVNSVVLVGRLTRDPERRGAALAMRLAYNGQRNTGSGWEDHPQYVDAACFGAQADAIEQMLTTGTRVVVQGRLAFREWQAPDGSQRQSYSIACQHVQIVDGWRERSGSSAPEPARAAADDDVPF